MTLLYKKGAMRLHKFEFEAPFRHAKTIALVPIKICGWFIVASMVGMVAQSATATPVLGWLFFVGILGFAVYRTIRTAYRHLTKAEAQSMPVVHVAATPSLAEPKQRLVGYNDKTEPFE